ncbi:MAG: Dabb family protein [Gemmatimonadales bacterium]|nr:MAG: Dabb family protein [Gemmatimonadales bacterium]
MLLHVVAFRFRPGTAAAAIEAAGDALLAMEGRIAEIREIRWVPNLAPGVTDYTHVLTVLLDDLAGLERYTAHPVHQRVVTELLAPIREARLALDIDVPAHH